MNDKPLISIADNSKLGTHIYTTTSRTDILKKYFDSGKKISIGKYTIDKKSICFKKQKESKWLIEVPIGFEIRSGCFPKLP